MDALLNTIKRKFCSSRLKNRKQKITSQANSVEEEETKMMRKPFLEELEELHIQFYHMGLKVHEAVQEAVRAFLTEDLEAAKKVVSNDKEINQREQEIERFSIELIALQQPISSDLRKNVTVMKASVELERIGDHAGSLR